MKQPSRILPLISFAVLLAALPLAFFAAERRYYRLDNYLAAHPAQEAVLFSLEETLFTGDTALLELSLPDELGQYAEIRYTTDGSTPTAHSTLYTGPILLDASGGRKCFPVQAVAVQDGRQSGVCARTYFPAGTAAFGEDVLIVSLTCEPEDLYGQETGILALGAATQEEADSDPTLPLNFNGTARANYYGRGAEWERPVTVEIYDNGGGLLLSQKAGIRVTGGASRENGQKSLRLYARASYDEQNPKFSSAALFGTETSADGSGTPVTEYNHLDLRSGGNDWPFTMLGDATMRALAAEAGLAPVGQCRPAAVYLNGAFYGVAWLQPDYCDDNIAEWCGLSVPENIRVVETALPVVGEGTMVCGEHPEEAEAFAAMYALALQDLTDPANAAALEAVLDIDNFLLYYALEMYSCNSDWPQNNCKAWRYINAGEDELAANSYADGRWRFLLYDVDPAYNTYVDQPDSFDRLLGDAAMSPMLASVLKNDDFRSRFLNIWRRLLQTVLQPENALALTERYRALLEEELLYREAADPEQTVFDGSYRQLLYRKIENFITERPQQIEEKLAQYLGTDTADTYTLELTVPEGASVLTDGFIHTETSAGVYYREAAMRLRADTAAGLRLTGWSVNGQTLYTEELLLDPADWPGDTIRVAPILTADPDAGLLLEAIAYRSDANWIELRNYGAEAAELTGYTLVKNGGEAVFELPELTLSAGETLRIPEADDRLTAEQRGLYAIPLELRRGDTLTLLAPDGTAADSLTLPAKQPGWVYARDARGDGWVWHAQK